jgi:hypothetical protein
MRLAYDLFGEQAFRKQQTDATRILPINKALLETWTYHLSALPQTKCERLLKRKAKLNGAFIELLEDDKKFDGAISQGTGKPEKIRYRFQAIEKLVRRIAR